MNKKLITLALCLLGLTATANAQDHVGAYNGNLSINLSGGEPTDMGSKTIDIYPGSTEGKVTFVLPDFVFRGVLDLGDIVLPDVPVTENRLNLKDFPLYIADLTETVTISMDEGSGFNDTQLTAYLTITIPSLNNMDVPVTFVGERQGAEGYQVRNGGFEDWEDVTSDIDTKQTGKEPIHWNSFVAASVDADPNLNSFMVNMLKMAINGDQLKASDQARPGSTGTKSALVTAKWQVIKAANGNLTTGRINCGSTEPTSPYNHNASNPKNDDKYLCPFTGTPDSLSVWVKYKPFDGDITNEKNAAGIKAIIHNSNRYQDPEDSTKVDGVMVSKYDTVKVAEAITSYQAVENYGWQRISVPFTYFEGEQVVKDSAKYIMVSFSTNATPGYGATNKGLADSLYVDDIALIYNSELTKLNVGGTDVALEAGVYNYQVDKAFDDETIVIAGQTNGTGATVVTGFNRQAKTATVIVRGGDFAGNTANAKVYTLTFKGGEGTGISTPEIPAAKVYVNERVLHVAGATTPVQVFGVDGRLITTSIETETSLPSAGIYLVNVNGQTHKVMAY